MQDFPAGRGKWQISRDGGRFPAWSRDGRELFFLRSPGELMSVRITPRQGDLEIEAPKRVFTLADEQFFRRMVRSIFGKRRKTLRNSLAYFTDEEGIAVQTRLADIDLQQRPENLTLEELVHLSNVLRTAGT